MVSFSYYGNKIRAEFQDPLYKAQKQVQLNDSIQCINTQVDSAKEKLYINVSLSYLFSGLK